MARKSNMRSSVTARDACRHDQYSGTCQPSLALHTTLNNVLLGRRTPKLCEARAIRSKYLLFKEEEEEDKAKSR
jgi:hypothetical protein